MYLSAPIIALLSFCFSLPEENTFVQYSGASEINQSYRITFLGADEIYNNHVGNEWVFFAEINGKRIWEGESLTVDLSSGETISLQSVLMETNEKYNDIATEENTIDLQTLVQFSGTGFYQEVTIRESNGRYAGNTAGWKFYYQVDD